MNFLKNAFNYLTTKPTNQNQHHVYVFDLDNTITNKHTGGHYQKGTSSTYITSKMLRGVSKLFYQMKTLGLVGHPSKIYINSRGIASNVSQFLRDTGLYQYVDGIYAANYDGKQYHDENLKITTMFQLEDSRWNHIKSLYLKEIQKKENVDFNHIYFFDDSTENISTAIHNGFKNSFVVNSNMYPKPWDKFNLCHVVNNLKIT